MAREASIPEHEARIRPDVVRGAGQVRLGGHAESAKYRLSRNLCPKGRTGSDYSEVQGQRTHCLEKRAHLAASSQADPR